MNKIFAGFALALLVAAPAAAQEWGNLKMKFVVDGKAPTPVKLDITKDQAFCGVHGLVNERITVGKNGELANVVVYLQAAPKPIHPDYGA